MNLKGQPYLNKSEEIVFYMKGVIVSSPSSSAGDADFWKTLTSNFCLGGDDKNLGESFA